MEGLFFAAAYLSEIIGTVVGFGSSTIFLPLAILFYDFKTALVLVALLHVFGNLGRVNFFRRGLDRKMMVMFGVPSVFFALMGAFLVAYTPQDFLERVLGVFLTVYAFLSLWKDELRIKPRVVNIVIGGSLSGFFAGLIGTGGAVRGAYLTAFRVPKEKYIATAAMIALAVDVTRLPVYFTQGFLDRQFYWFIPLLFIAAILGSFTGKQIVKRVPQREFRKIVLVAILAIGIRLIV